MPTLLHPGVYVREAPGPRAIEGVSTSVPIFVGETERGPLDVTRIIGRREYTTLFGGYRRRITGIGDPTERLMLPYALDGYFSNGGTSAYVLRLCDGFNSVVNTTVTAFRTEPAPGVLEFIEASSPGAWGNSVRVAAALSTDSTLNTDRARVRLAVFYRHPGTTTDVLVEEWDRLSPVSTDDNYIVDVLRRSNYIRWRTNPATNTIIPPFVPAVLDNIQIGPFPTAASLVGSAVALGSGAGGFGTFAAADLPVFLTERLQEIDEASLMVAASSRMGPESTITDQDFVTFENFFISYVNNNRPLNDLFFIGELPSLVGGATPPVTAAVNWGNGALGFTPATQPTEYNAVYWPHIQVPDPIGVGSNPQIMIPPAGYVAGQYARTDGRRGVWKAPAGVEVQLAGVTGLEFDVLDAHQDSLNPIGINAIRRIPRAGLVVWGARTRVPATQWRYVPVRRTAIFLRISIHRNIQWATFEPNDAKLWQSLRNTIGAFMEIQYRNGAFAGATSREAYFVKVDAETTTPADQAAGIVNILVGFAPLRPAEFVVVTLQQIAQPAP